MFKKQRYFLTVWPRRIQYDLFFEGNKNVCVEMLYRALESDFRKPDYLKKLKSLFASEDMSEVDRWSKLYAISIKVKDLGICKLFLEATIHRIPTKYLVGLIKEFGEAEFKKELKARVLPVRLNFFRRLAQNIL